MKFELEIEIYLCPDCYVPVSILTRLPHGEKNINVFVKNARKNLPCLIVNW
jgi:hypothetical protein